MRDARGRFQKGHHVSTEWKKGDHISPATQFKKGQRPSPDTEFKKGEPSPHKGTTKRYSSETLAKMSAAKKGKRPAQGTLDNLRAMAKLRKGPNHHYWKGGISQNARRSPRYKAWRSAVMLRDNYTCQFCGQYNGVLHADHIKSWALHPDLRYDITNGRTLCRACHYYITFKTKMPVNSTWGLPTMTKKEG